MVAQKCNVSANESICFLKNLEQYKKRQLLCCSIRSRYKKIITFSGYWDCNDKEMLQLLLGNRSIDSATINAFESIATENGAQLVTFTPDVVDQIATYNIRKNYRLENCGTLRDKLHDSMGGIALDINFIKKSFSCCERKILSQLKAEKSRL